MTIEEILIKYQKPGHEDYIFCEDCPCLSSSADYCPKDCTGRVDAVRAIVKYLKDHPSMNAECTEVPLEEPSNENETLHAQICSELNTLYARKNRDYGDSFHLTYLEEGMAMPRIRLDDKLNRFKTLTRKGGAKVKDESVRDTLIDLANYAIMTVMEMDREEHKNGHE